MNSPSELLIFHRILNKDNIKPFANERITPIQERMKNLLTNLISNQPSNYKSPLRIEKNLKKESVNSLMHREKLTRKREEIVNLMGGCKAINKPNKNHISSYSSNNGKNMVVSGIQREVNQILGNMNKIVNAQPKYLRYTKTKNDNTFLTKKKIERSKSNYFNCSIIDTKDRKTLNRTSSTKSNYTSNVNYYNDLRPITSCPYHNERLIKMQLGLSSL